MKGGVWLYITSQWEVWNYIQWRVVCDSTSHHNEKCETTLNEGKCITLDYITMRSVRLYSMKGGVLLYVTSQWEVWNYIQWRVMCYFRLHHNEKCETILNEGWCVQRKLGSNLPNYGQIELRDFAQWRVVWELTSHLNEKYETTFNEGWCVTLHHITMRSVRLYSMKGGVLLYIHHNKKCKTTTCKTHSNGCMDVTWASFWGKAGAGNLVFFRVKWLRPAMKGTSCVRRVQLGSNGARIGSSFVFCNEWLFMCAQFYAFLDSLVADRSVMAAWSLLFCVAMCVERCGLGTLSCQAHCNGCILHGFRFGESRGRKPCVFPCKMAPAGDERYIVCAAGAAGVEPGANQFLLCVLQWVLCVFWLSGCRSPCNGCMIVIVLCCHVRREMRVGNFKLPNAL